MARKKKIFLGYEVKTASQKGGKETAIPIFHTLFTGQTQMSGKTSTMKALAQQVVASEEYKVLILDTKVNLHDYENFGQEIPVCLRQTTDPLVLRDLLESINQRKITPFQSTLIQITSGTKTFEDVIANAQLLSEKKRLSGFKKDACTTLIDLLKRLIEQTKKFKTTVELELPYPINVMTINDFDLQGQQLIANTVFSEVLTKFKNTIIILDEAYKFLPQKWGSPCKARVQEFVTQGAATGDFLWMSTQFMAPTDKDAMKAMPVKLLGRQDHITEIEDTQEMIPNGKKQFPKDFIMQLKVGHFVVVTTDGAKIIYVCPEFADENDCYEVAMGLRDPSEIHYIFNVTADDYDKVRKKIKPIPSSKTKKLLPTGDKSSPSTALAPPPSQDAVQPILQPQPQEETPDDIAIEIDVEQIHRQVTIRKVVRHVTVSDETVRGKILTLAADQFLAKPKALGDFVKEIQRRGWTANYQGLKRELPRLTREGLLGRKKIKKGYYYSVCPNVVFRKDVAERESS